MKYRDKIIKAFNLVRDPGYQSQTSSLLMARIAFTSTELDQSVKALNQIVNGKIQTIRVDVLTRLAKVEKLLQLKNGGKIR